MVVRLLFATALLASLALAVPSAASSSSAETFYHGPGATLVPSAPEAGFADAVGQRTATQNIATDTIYMMTLKSGGDVVPESIHLYVELEAPTIVPPASAPGVGVCPVMIYIGILDKSDGVKWSWWLCSNPGLLTTLVPGVIEFKHDYSDLTPAQASAGDRIYMSIWAEGTSTYPAPTMFLLGGGDYPSSITLRGTNEVPDVADVPESEEDPSNPVSTTETTSPATSGPSTSSPPSSSQTRGPESSATDAPSSQEPSPDAPVQGRQDAKASPAGGILLVVLAALGLAARRRLP